METARQVVARRHREGDFTEEEILSIAARIDFPVHKYRRKHEALRKLVRQLERDGKLHLVAFDGREFFYRTPKGK